MLIINRFFSHKIHPDYNFPLPLPITIHSPYHPPLPISLQKKASLQETKVKRDKCSLELSHYTC